jgi:hypothetical protein
VLPPELEERTPEHVANCHGAAIYRCLGPQGLHVPLGEELLSACVFSDWAWVGTATSISRVDRQPLGELRQKLLLSEKRNCKTQGERENPRCRRRAAQHHTRPKPPPPSSFFPRMRRKVNGMTVRVVLYASTSKTSCISNWGQGCRWRSSNSYRPGTSNAVSFVLTLP